MMLSQCSPSNIMVGSIDSVKYSWAREWLQSIFLPHPWFIFTCICNYVKSSQCCLFDLWCKCNKFTSMLTWLAYSTVYNKIVVSTVNWCAKRVSSCMDALHVFCIGWIQPFIHAIIFWQCKTRSGGVESEINKWNY